MPREIRHTILHVRPKKIWSDEAIRIIIRYNYERGLTVRQCLDEMDPLLQYDELEEEEEKKLITIYRVYRELTHGIYNYVGNFTLPFSPVESYRVRVLAETQAEQTKKEVEQQHQDLQQQLLQELQHQLQQMESGEDDSVVAESDREYPSESNDADDDDSDPDGE